MTHKFCYDEDDENSLSGLYESGHWIWDETVEGLAFISDRDPTIEENFQLPIKPPTGPIEFRDNLDLVEQMRFRRRYQRKVKAGNPDVITIQDIKDIALFTAPVTLLSPLLIDMLHLPTTERFIRALILCCQYYLQMVDEMAHRKKELQTKIRTPECDVVEKEYRDNLSDLRVLVAKEYCTMLLGGADTRKFHHMGYYKKRHSLSDKDARLFETLLRMCVQIVWLALGRKSFNQIGYIYKMSKEERGVLLGHCLKRGHKLNTCSPLMNEVLCQRSIDYRLMGLGVVNYSELTPRLRYMLRAISSPEEDLMNLGVTVGILGMHRSLFDTMLHPLPPVYESKSKLKGSASGATASTKSVSSVSQRSQKSVDVTRIIYPNVVLPPKERKQSHFPSAFPTERETVRPCSEEQRSRWRHRLLKLLRRPRNSSYYLPSSVCMRLSDPK